MCGFRLYFSMTHFIPDKSHYSWIGWNTNFVPSLNPSNPLSGIVLCEDFHLKSRMLNYKTLNVTQNSVNSGQCPVYNQEEAELFMVRTHIFHHGNLRNPPSQCGHRNYHQTWNGLNALFLHTRFFWLTPQWTFPWLYLFLMVELTMVTEHMHCSGKWDQTRGGTIFYWHMIKIKLHAECFWHDSFRASVTILKMKKKKERTFF